MVSLCCDYLRNFDIPSLISLNSVQIAQAILGDERFASNGKALARLILCFPDSAFTVESSSFMGDETVCVLLVPIELRPLSVLDFIDPPRVVRINSKCGKSYKFVLTKTFDTFSYQNIECLTQVEKIHENRPITEGDILPDDGSLPPNWIAIRSPKRRGKIMYVNTELKRYSWEHPKFSLEGPKAYSVCTKYDDDDDDLYN